MPDKPTLPAHLHELIDYSRVSLFLPVPPRCQGLHHVLGPGDRLLAAALRPREALRPRVAGVEDRGLGGLRRSAGLEKMEVGWPPKG